MPTPTASCGAIVQATEAVGRKASAAVPAATSSAPPAARTGGGPPILVAASAARGITLTASAAVSGSIAPAGDQQQHDQEQRGCDRAGYQPEGQRPAQRPAWPLRHGRPAQVATLGQAAAPAATAGGSQCRQVIGAQRAGQRHQHRGRLEQEDRAPAEGLGQRAADGRARCGAEQSREAPELWAGSRALAGEQRIRGYEQRRAAQGLYGAGQQEDVRACPRCRRPGTRRRTARHPRGPPDGCPPLRGAVPPAAGRWPGPPRRPPAPRPHRPRRCPAPAGSAAARGPRSPYPRAPGTPHRPRAGGGRSSSCPA